MNTGAGGSLVYTCGTFDPQGRGGAVAVQKFGPHYLQFSKMHLLHLEIRTQRTNA